MTNNDTGMVLVAGGIATVAGLYAVATPFLMPAFRRHCLPYVAANRDQIQLVKRVCLARNARTVTDLGSGDGIVCRSLAAELRIRTRGVELNPWLVYYSKIAARFQGVSDLCEFRVGDLFKEDVSNTDAVVLFVVPAMMEDLATKLSSELRPGSLVLAGRFPLDISWTPLEILEAPTASLGYNINRLWVYRYPDSLLSSSNSSQSQQHSSSSSSS
mmetsp:Transcript_7026/g.9857  ORF Transcript_7026/g.9857 Transcript_7026/m.9857 type:complete len:215 (-) Transcript_7026:1037-1681(-)